MAHGEIEHTNNPSTLSDQSFPEILYDLLKEESKRGDASPIRWAKDGGAFVVDSTPALNAILLKYFNYSSYNSLLKMLDLYSFKRFQGAFYHPLFHKNKRENAVSIKRKPPPTTGSIDEKLGTRKRKVKRRNSEASESSSLLREAALVKADGLQETYYYGSDFTDHDNSTLGDERNESFEAEIRNNYKNPDAPVVDNMQIVCGTHNSKRNKSEGGSYKVTAKEPIANGFIPVNDTMIEESPTVDEDKLLNGHLATTRIILPLSLKQIMVKTWETIRLHNVVPDLPAHITVRKTLDMYVDTRFHTANSEKLENGESGKRRKIGWKDMAEGIALFFEKALESHLLYPQERPQLRALEEAMSDSDKQRRMSDIFGCEYLLRLFLRLPDILIECVADETRMHILQDIVEFVRFIHQHQDTLFPTNYRKLTNTELNEITH